MGKTLLKCDCKVINENFVKRYKKGFSKNKMVIDLSRLFYLLSDNTRVSILTILDGNEVCVSDIASILDMTKSAVSHQLKILKDASLIKGSKRGKEVFYSFYNENIRSILELAINHIQETN